jgi:small subunit ribosomal protein S17
MVKQTKQKQKTQEAKESSMKAVGTRGRVFEGYVVKKFNHRAVIEYESTVFVRKYERFYKKKSKLHARIPANMSLEIGDYVKIKGCRPLSKIINHVVIEKIRSVDSKEIKK